MKKTLSLVFAAITVSCLSTPLFAWNGFGHMVVASVAYRQLDSQTRARVDKLIALNPYYTKIWKGKIPAGTKPADANRLYFMLAATWPDEIKTDDTYHDDGSNGGDTPDGPEATRNTGYDDFNRHKYFHFEDIAFTQDGSNLTAYKVPSPNAGTQIAAFRAIIKSTSPDKLKSYDLVWLLHLVGDVHQPLHCATRISSDQQKGDEGGNKVGFCGANANQCTGELHAFWDDILGTSSAVAQADKFAGNLTAPLVSTTDIANAQDWIDASSKLAPGKAYVPPVKAGKGPFQATADYTTNAKTLATQQVALAGARLAKVIQTDLK